MGSGIDLARVDAPEHAAALDNMKDQLLIVLLNRLGGDVSVPVEEVDATGKFVCFMRVADRTFKFVVKEKQ